MRAALTVAFFLIAAGCPGGPSRVTGATKSHRGDFADVVLLTGELEAVRGGIVSVPQLPTWQTAIKWLAADGAAVKAGDRVVELDNASFTADLDTRRQAETQALQEIQQKTSEWSADLRDKELDLEKKRSEFEKASLEAAVPQEIISGREFQDRQMKYRRAEVELKKARDVVGSQRKAIASDRANLDLKLRRASREVLTAEAAIETLVLRAPRDGIVVVKDHPWEQRKLQDGDTVWIGFPIAMIPELDSLEVTAALPDVDDGRVKPGMPAKVTLDAYPGMVFPGKIETISAVAQESNRNGSMRRVFRVAVALDRIDHARMRPGLSARVEVRRAAQRDALLVPRGAVDFSGSAPRVRLAAGRLVPVSLGDCNAQECVVRSGLEEGEDLGS